MKHVLTLIVGLFVLAWGIATQASPIIVDGSSPDAAAASIEAMKAGLTPVDVGVLEEEIRFATFFYDAPVGKIDAFYGKDLAGVRDVAYEARVKQIERTRDKFLRAAISNAAETKRQLEFVKRNDPNAMHQHGYRDPTRLVEDLERDLSRENQRVEELSGMSAAEFEAQYRAYIEL